MITNNAITWMAAIIGERTAIEVGTGPALISAELQACGTFVTATDPNQSGSDQYGFTQTLTTVEA